MIPAYFVLLDAFPLTPNGKIDRKGLPAPDLSNNSAEYLAPETSTEKVLADIWCGLLKVEKVGINDNFFNLGGHSLLATQLISKISKKFDISLEISDFFISPILSDFSKIIDLKISNKILEKNEKTILLKDKINERLNKMSLEEISELLARKKIRNLKILIFNFMDTK